MKQVLNKEINNHNRKIEQLQQKIKDAQEVCQHEGVKKTPGANTGNWCKDDDSYWYTFDCPVCGKIWREDQ
jgi:hypothetical protein